MTSKAIEIGVTQNLPPGVEHAINNPLLKETASIIAITPVGDPVAIALERDLTFRANCWYYLDGRR